MENYYIDKDKLLFLIVGVGKADDSYYAIQEKAIKESTAGTVCLLCSSKSHNVERIIENFKNCEVISRNLPEKSEFNADKCYEYFERIFSDFLKDFKTENIIIDFTHGTKPMSVALYAIGIRYNIGNFQYVVRESSGDKNFVEGAERVETFDAYYAKWLSIKEECKLLFKSWQFDAVSTILSKINLPKKFKQEIECIKMLADFYAAWDRLDYEIAAKEYPEFFIPKDFLAPSVENKYILDNLTQKMKIPNDELGEVLSQEELNYNRKIIINLMFDIYANGLRRLSAGKLEDAIIRAYKLADLLGQVYLLEKGYMPDHMSCSDDQVSHFLEDRRKNKINGKDICRFQRGEIISFLKYIKSPIADFLISVNSDIEKRNSSILTHGYSSIVNKDNNLQKIFEELINKLRPLTDDFENKKGMALFMNKFKDEL